jgi:hypothetical protein
MVQVLMQTRDDMIALEEASQVRIEALSALRL